MWSIGYCDSLLLVKTPLFFRASLYLINVNIIANLFSALCRDGNVYSTA